MDMHEDALVDNQASLLFPSGQPQILPGPVVHVGGAIPALADQEGADEDS